MKLVKMSLAAAVLLGASAFAIDNIKIDGDASVYYGTNNAEYTPNNGTVRTSGLFDKDASFADTALRVGVTGDLMKGVSFGLTGYAVSTLGLENNLVSNTWTGAHGAAGNTSSFGAQVNDQAWMGEAWVAATLGKTTAKLGRMALDTPLAFSETWSIVPNTFEGAVLINQDIPDTTLIGAWVGKGNGTSAVNGYHGPVGVDNVVAAAANFNTFMADGAYAAAVINNSFKPLVAQAWYYNVVNVADAYWLQADWDCLLIKNVKVGVQYADMSPKGLISGAKDSDAYAGKLAYVGVEGLKVSGAYSKTDKDGALNVANVATDNATSQSKLYTEAYWNYGYVGAPGAESFNVSGEYTIKDVVALGAYYTDVNNKNGFTNVNAASANHDLTEIALTASKDFGPLNATLAYFSTDAKDQNVKAFDTTGSRYDSVLAMLKLKF
jgi:hypothetical protein